MKNNRISELICIAMLLFPDNQASLDNNILDRRRAEHLPPLSKIDTSVDSANCEIFSPKYLTSQENKASNVVVSGKHQSPNSIMDCAQDRVTVAKLDMSELEALSPSKIDDTECIDGKPKKKRDTPKEDSTASSPSKMRQGRRWFGENDKIIFSNRGKSRSQSKKHKRHFGSHSEHGYYPDKGKFDKRSEYHRLAELEKRGLEDSDRSISLSNSDEY